MIGTLNVKMNIPSRAEAVRKAIRKIGGLDRWFPVIASCRVEGVGATGTLVLTDGGAIQDRVEEVDDTAGRLRCVRVRHPFPVRQHTGTVNVRDAGSEGADVTPSVEIAVTPGPATIWSLLSPLHCPIA
jgi:hypothetical protein